MKQRILTQVTIEKLGYGGVGIGRLENGKLVLVKGGLPGSVVDGKVLKQKKDYIELQITKVHSFDATLLTEQVACPHYLFAYSSTTDTPLHKQGCGGCKRQAVPYPQQLVLKHQMIADSLRKVPACQEVTLPDVIGAPMTLQYRNKIEFSFGTFRVRDDELTGSEERSGKFQEHITLGFHQQGRFAQIMDVDQCFLVSPRMHEIFTILKEELLNSGLPVYRVVQHTGLLRHLVIRSGVHTDQLLVHLVIASHRFVDHPDHERIRKELLENRAADSKKREMITTLVVSENNGLADIVHHQETTMHTIRGEGRIFEELHLGEQIARFQVSPLSFFQTNTLGAEVLFTKAAELVGNINGLVLDLYCGSGTIGISFLKQQIGNELIGIEVVPEAIADAEKNAQINGVGERTQFFVGKVEDLVRTNKHLAERVSSCELVVVDPPREGLHKNVIEFLIALRQTIQPKLLYISCNPVTFARDVGLLTAAGWKLATLQPVDMFPQTYHVEMIGVLR